MAAPAHIPEVLLLQRYYQTQDVTYLGQALQQYTTILLGVAMKYVKQQAVAEDLVQQVFLKALEKLPAQLTNLGGWLYMVMKHECMDYLRKPAHISNEAHPDYMHALAADEVNDDTHWAITFQEEKIVALIDTLKEEQRTCIRLFFLEHQSYQDIVEKTGYTLNDVKSYIQNGKRNLKIKFEKEKQS